MASWNFLSGTFDASAALAMMYLWLMFGFIAVLINCDLQRFLESHVLIRHILGLIAFFFLFTILDPQNENHVGIVFVKTVAIYILFVMATKSRWMFSGTALLFLFADLVLKYHISYLEKQNQNKEDIELYRQTRQILFVIIVSIILIGTMDYAIKQMREQPNFDWSAFFIGSEKLCKHH